MAVFAMLLLGASAAAVCFAAAQNAADWSRHTLRVELALDRAQILLMRAEINRRGFVMTGDPAQRDVYRASAARVNGELQTLDRMISDNPEQRANVSHLRWLFDRRLTDMADGVRFRDSGRLDEAVALTRASRGAIGSTMRMQDMIRHVERRLLKQREERAAALVRLGKIAFGVSAFLILALAWLVWRERRSRILALSEVNRELAIDMAVREQAEAQLEMLATNATDAVVRTTLDGACLYASPSAQEVFGVRPNWLIGRSLLALIVSVDRAAVAASLARLTSGESVRELVTCRQRRGSGPERWLEASSRLMHDPATGAPSEIIAAIRDVTVRKQLELELHTARHRAEDAVSAKAGFLANMSHEIRTPMNGVLGFADLVLAGDLTPEQRRYMELISESGRSMMRLLNDILDLSKIEAGRMLIADEKVDLRHVLRRCCGLMAPVAEQKGLSISVDVSPDLPARVAGDSLRVRQILLNLIGNAVKFTQAGGVSITAHAQHDRLRIAVRDTGIGIPADRLAHVFQIFAQAEDTTARRFGGSGLGLSISAELARLMDGGISLDSEPGRGSVFTLDLPLRAVDMEPAIEAPSQPAAQAWPAGERSRVLIAEDHEINQELICAMTRRAGAEPSLAVNGAEAVAMAEQAAAAGQPFAMVLMDMQMPDVDGVEATRRLRARGYTAEALPIVALTANAFADDIQACLDAGMQAHLAKPVQIDALAAIIARFSRAVPPVAPIAPVKISPKLLERYRARKADAIAAVEALVADDGEDSGKQHETALDLLHKLAGTAGMFGEQALGDQARLLEQHLPEWLAQKDDVRLRAAVAELHQAA